MSPEVEPLPCTPKCIQELPRPLQVPGVGLEQVPGAGPVHLPRPCVEQSLVVSQRMLLFPEQAPRQLPAPVESREPRKGIER